MVGRFVQQQDVGVPGKGRGQGRPPDLAARQAFRRLGGRQAKGLQGGLGFVRRGAGGDQVIKDGRAGDHRLLWDPGDAQAGNLGLLAVIDLHLAGQDSEQGGLARPVPADQAGAAAGFEGEVDPVEQHARPVCETDLPEGEHGWLHRAPLNLVAPSSKSCQPAGWRRPRLPARQTP